MKNHACTEDSIIKLSQWFYATCHAVIIIIITITTTITLMMISIMVMMTTFVIIMMIKLYDKISRLCSSFPYDGSTSPEIIVKTVQSKLIAQPAMACNADLKEQVRPFSKLGLKNQLMTASNKCKGKRTGSIADTQ